MIPEKIAERCGVATGAELTRLAYVGFFTTRNPGETDQELRIRIMGLLESSRFTGFNKAKPVNGTKTAAQRFGQLSRQLGNFGELRRQKKAPHKEILYIPVAATQVLKDGTTYIGGYVLRSINNASNDDLTDHIKRIAQGLEAGDCSQADAEFLLDLIYAELGQRVASADVIRARRTG